MSLIEAERWHHIEEVFHDVLQYPEDEREAYLTEVCRGDQSLFDEVRSLISSHERSGEFLEKPQLTTGLQLLAARDEKSHAGETIGHYVLQNRIGRGGMGDVYLALDRRLERNVALKLLPASFVNHPDWVSRFQNEARAASSIAHPNIAHVYEVAKSDGTHYIVMEYIEGVTLRQYLKRGRLKPIDAIDIIIQVARALSAAHSRGVLHRDIKPDNIMISADGYVKVLDFGLAKSTAPLKSEQNGKGLSSAVETGAGIIVGSPAYMSPEQARGLEVDHRSDLWSLGVVIYELLAQKNPFLSETPSDTIAAILKTEPVPLKLSAPGLPQELEGVVTKLLAKRAEDRYQSAESLIDDLRDLMEGLRYRKALEHTPEQSAGGDNQIAVPSSGLDGRQPLGIIESVASLPAYVLSATKPTKVRVSALLLLIVITLVILKYAIYSPPELHASPITSIAVLPFTNEHSDPNTEYISDGLSESLIERFSRLPRIKVIARGSSFKYKEKPGDLKSVARDLGVQALVVGRVTKLGEDLQVNVELVDLNQTTHLWTGHYHYKARDMTAILNDITRQVATRLNLGLSDDDLNLMTREQQAPTEAYEWYLKGRFNWNQLTEEALDESIECFNKALALDPHYALAYTGLANSYITLGANYRSPEETFPKAELNALKALELDSDLAEAHYALAAIRYVYYWDLSGTEKELKRALELNPNYAIANSLLSSLSLSRGDIKQATLYINRALELDPLSLLFNVRLSQIHYFQRDFEKAIKLHQKIMNENAAASFLYNDLAIVYAHMSRFDEALAASQRATILKGQDPDTLTTLGIVYALSGRTNEARWVAGTLENLSKEKYVQAYLIASIYGALGDKQQAFTWLEKAGKQRASNMLIIRVDPAFDKIRSDPRYAELLQSFNLAEQ